MVANRDVNEQDDHKKNMERFDNCDNDPTDEMEPKNSSIFYRK